MRDWLWPIPFFERENMDINNFVANLDGIIDEIDRKVNKIEEDTNTGIKAMPELVRKIQEILPDWFYFIEETGIGDKQVIVMVLNDIVDALEYKDKVLLEDVLLFGMQPLMLQYKNVIEEALHGE